MEFTAPRAIGESGMLTQAESLLQAIGPDLYRVNGFRLAQLTSDASQRDVARRLEKIAMLAKLDGAAEQTRGPLALTPPPSVDAVRAAVERLRDPEARLLDEFFWFWQETGATDDALASLAHGDVAAARKQWQESGSAVAQHNLAVLAHLLALDLECRSLALAPGRTLDSFLCRLRDQAWTTAWQSWQATLQAQEFWDHFRERIRELNEPQLPEALATDFRRALPVTLLGINAQLAVQWAERRLPLEAARHRDLLKRSGLDALDGEEALRRALRPVRERIKTLCATAASADSHANWQTAVELFKGVAGLPARAVDRDNLLEDAGPALYRICWFCQKRASQPGSEATVPLHGRVTRQRSNSGESLHWDRHFIEVPRCWPCLQAHQHWDMHKALGTLPAGIRPEADKKVFPFVTKFLLDGWGMGSVPEGM
jgi:hypothetical protein